MVVGSTVNNNQIDRCHLVTKTKYTFVDNGQIQNFKMN